MPYFEMDNFNSLTRSQSGQSVLHKRHNAINYHVIRESVAAKMMVVGKEDTETNISDLFTKVLTAERRNYLCGFIFR